MDLEKNELEYTNLIKTLGDVAEKFLIYLNRDRVKFFEKPYNNYSGSDYAGSLCEYSLILYHEVVKLAEIYCPNKYSRQDIIKATLLSNFYRAELYEPYLKNVKNEITGQWEQVQCYRVKETHPTFGAIGMSSYMIAKKFFDLSDEVAMAIIYGSENNFMDSFLVRKNFGLLNLVSMANTSVAFFEKTNMLVGEPG